MEQHVKIIGIIDIVFGVLAIIAGVFFLLAFMIGAVGFSTQQGLEGGAEGAAIFASIGIFGGIIIMIIGALQIFVGIKLRAYRSWARIVQIILGIMQLFNFPFGTAFGVYSLWAMFKQETAALFEQKQAV